MKNRHRISISLAIVAILFLLINCAMAVGKINQATNKVLKHVVAIKFHEDASEENIEHAIDIFADLEDKIPQIKDFEGGKNINSSGPTQEFSHCFVLTFNSEEDRDIYMPHPAHQKVVENNKPLIENLLVIDYWAED